MTARKCTYGVDCPRLANTPSGRCDLHDAIAMAEDASDLLTKALGSLDQRARKDREEIERRDGPEGTKSGGASDPPLGKDVPSGLSERPITCARCGRELKSLEQIRAALEAAPAEALAAGRDQRSDSLFAFALGHLESAVHYETRALACHAGTCHRGMM